MKDETHWFSELEREMARWTDLSFRAHHPCARSELWQLNDRSWQLYVPTDDLDACQHETWFNDSIRPVSCNIHLTNQRPENATRISKVEDREIGGALAGMHLTTSEVEIYLAGRFPELPPIIRVTEEPRVRHFACESLLEAQLQQAAEETLQSILPGFDVKLVGGAAPEIAPTVPSVPLGGLGTRPLSRRKNLPEFIRDEETRWFANFEAMFAGDFSPDDFPIRHRNTSTACFLPSYVGRTSDLRQLLMAFDIAYLELPIRDGEDSGTVEDTFGITTEQLCELVQGGRVRIVTRQPEERISLGLLRELHEVCPSAVAGRRATAEVVVADLVRTAQNSLFAVPEVRATLPKLIEVVAQQLGRDNAEEIRCLLLPETMIRRIAPHVISHGASMIGDVGIGGVFANELERLKGEDFRFEAYSFADDIHLAHALGATLVPRPEGKFTDSWIPIMRGMGKALNFHAGCTPQNLEAWLANERAKDRGEVVLPPVPVFEFEDRWRNDTSLRDVLDVTSRGTDRKRAFALISRLANLPQEDRVAEADRLASELRAHLGSRRGKINKIEMVGEAASAVLECAGAGVVRFLLKALSYGTDRASSSSSVIDNFTDAVSRFIKRGQNDDLDILAKVDRVARLRVSKDG